MERMDYQEILDRVKIQIGEARLGGEVASYIPELAKVSPKKFGMHLTCVDGRDYSVGDSEERFSIQSISKVLLLARALSEVGRELWKRVHVEPSGDPFNSLVQLECERGIPRNPFINAGALVVCDLLVSQLDDPKSEFLRYVRQVAGEETLCYDAGVAASEQEHAYHNCAMINLMKAFGNIENDVEAVLDFYFHACSITMSCRELARTFALFANQGKLLGSGEQILTARRTKRTNALMQTCGFYDEAGEFSFRVGLPGKSGVGGGVVAVHPSQFSVAVWSPRLNEKGNSAEGILALELLTNFTGTSIF
jgi:glutaminase